MQPEDRQDFLIKRAFQVALATKRLKDFIARDAPELLNRRQSVLLAVSEALTNILKHAKWGNAGFEIAKHDDRDALVFTTTDKGSGIKNIDNARKKGYSTAGTLGLGFQVMLNNTDFLEVKNTDTGLSVRMGWYLKSLKKTKQKTIIDHAEFMKPMKGYLRGGDYVFTKELQDNIFFAAVFDVLGHGPVAYRSALRLQTICSEFKFKGTMNDTKGLLFTAGQVLNKRHLRGAVAAAGIFIPQDGHLFVTGTGNISVSVLTDGHFALPAFSGGVIGDGTLRLRDFDYQAKKDMVWGMASDGFSSSWASRIKQAGQYTAKEIVEKAVKHDFRDTDDSSIMVMRWKSN